MRYERAIKCIGSATATWEESAEPSGIAIICVKTTEQSSKHITRTTRDRVSLASVVPGVCIWSSPAGLDGERVIEPRSEIMGEPGRCIGGDHAGPLRIAAIPDQLLTQWA